MSTKVVQVKPLTLSSGIGTSNTTAIVSGMIGLDGVGLTQSDFGTIIYGTLEPNSVREEAVSFTITSNTAGVANINFTASGRGLIGKFPYGTGGVAYAHSAGVKLVISNNPNLFNKFTAKDNNEVVTGAWEFPAPSAGNNPATKAYADSLVISGAGDASTIAKGLSRISASPNVTKGTTTITIATPGVVTFNAHTLTADDSVQFTTTGALPTGLVVSTNYYVRTTGLTANTFQLSTTVGGAAINTTGSQSGVHTLIKTTPVAVGLNDTSVLLTANEKAAAAGGGVFGTPSSTNKFTTDDFFDDTANFIRNQVSLTYLPVPVFTQDIYLNLDAVGSNEFAMGANSTGSVIYITIQNAALNFYRFERDNLTGAYYRTHNVALGAFIPAGDNGGVVVIGAYVYLFTNNGTNIICSRYDADTLLNHTVVTVPTVLCGAATLAWTDGVDAYVVSGDSPTTSRRWTLSGTTFSEVSTTTITSLLEVEQCSFWDGTNAYVIKTNGTGQATYDIVKLGTITGSTQTTTTKTMPSLSDARLWAGGFGVDSRMYLCEFFQIYDETATINTVCRLFPVTKP